MGEKSCVFCPETEDLNPHLRHADGTMDWLCDECEEMGRGLKW